jgi:hypothetical protein
MTLIYFSCSINDPAKSDDKEITFSAKQSGCNMILGKGNNNDSSFTYSFYDILKVDFGIWGNCCPDSNRFVTDCKLESDTIFVTVKDTAENGCYCNCPYTIHLELSGLTKEQYLFFMTYPAQYNRGDSLRYREIVKKIKEPTF